MKMGIKRNVAVATPRLKPLVALIKQALLLLTAGAYTSITLAGPEGGIVTGGSGAINQTGATTIIQQSSQNMAIDWQPGRVGTFFVPTRK